MCRRIALRILISAYGSAGLQTPVLRVDKLKLREGDVVTAVCTAEGEIGSLTFFFSDESGELYRMTTESQRVEHKLAFTEQTVNMFCYYSIYVGSTIKRSNNSNVIGLHIEGRSIIIFFLLYCTINVFVHPGSVNTFFSNSELKIKPNIKVNPSKYVIEGDRITFSCSVDISNSTTRIILVHGRTTLSSNMAQEEYSMSVKADDSGEYECISHLGEVDKSSTINITVKGERLLNAVFLMYSL